MLQVSSKIFLWDCETRIMSFPRMSKADLVEDPFFAMQCQAKQQWKENWSIYRPDQCCLLLAELSSCDKILIKLHCRAWKNHSLARGFSKQLQPFTCHFLELFSFEFISHNPIASYCLVTFLPGQIRWSVRFPSTPLTGLIKLEEALPQRRTWLRFILQKDPSRGEARLKRRVWHGRCTSSQVQFFISPWRTHIWSPLKPPEMNVMKVQWVKYVGHELGMYQRVEHAVSTRTRDATCHDTVLNMGHTKDG